MRKKRNDFDAVGAERMTDTELSKKLGSYQRTESIGILLGVKMCIRDRPITMRCGVKRTVSLKSFRSTGSLISICLRRVSPVSYTHLDVFKRQMEM